MLHPTVIAAASSAFPRWGEGTVFVAMVLVPCAYALLLRFVSAERR
jgi:hypothetical protein